MKPSWRLLESLGGVLGGLRGVLGGAGTALEAYKRRLGGSQGRLGAVLGPLEAMLEPSGGQKAFKMEPKRVPNRAPEATRAENGETLIFDDSTKDFNDFSHLRISGILIGVKSGSKMGSKSQHRRRGRQKAS